MEVPSGRPVRVPPPPPPLSEFTKKSSDPNCFEKVDESEDVEEGEVMEGGGGGATANNSNSYTANFCSPVKVKMDDESLIHFSANLKEGDKNTPPSRDHPVVQQLLKLDGNKSKTAATTAATTAAAAVGPSQCSSSSSSDGSSLPLSSSFKKPMAPASSSTAQQSEGNASSKGNASSNEATDDKKEAEAEKEEEELEEGEANQEEITLEFLQQRCVHQLLDKQFMKHLSEINPISALHEITQKLGWTLPNMKVAFECGPPLNKMYIFKAVVNGQEYQPTIAVDNKKDAKANAAWFALQEMGFVNPDASNPL